MNVHLICLLLLYRLGFVGGDPDESNNVRTPDSPDRQYLRTALIVEQRTELGRMVLLMCKRNCGKLRSQIPQWVRDYNDEKEYEGLDMILYHYHSFRQPLPFMEPNTTFEFPLLVYVIANEAHYYEGDSFSKQSVLLWLVSLDLPRINYVDDDDTLTDLFDNQRGNCSEPLMLMINNELSCPLPHYHNIIRHIWLKFGILPVHIRLPLTSTMSVNLYKRLALLHPSSCRQLVLLHQGSYTMPLDDSSPKIVEEQVSILLPPPNNISSDDCGAVPEEYWHDVLAPLTDIQLIYYSGEHDLQDITHNKSYVLVGLSAGISVIALAISIFWGLNGSAFAK